MAKKEKETVEIEVATPTLVAVEMSPAERDAFVEFMAAKQGAAPKPQPEATSTKLSLTYVHHINGKKFGPGHVEIPQALVGLLQEQEHLQRDLELARFQSKERMFKVLQSGQAIDVTRALANSGGIPV